MSRSTLAVSALAASVLLAGPGCNYDPNDYSTQVGSSMLRLELGDSVLPADGASTTTIVASVPASQAAHIGSLKVSATLATIREKGSPAVESLALNDSGVVRATLVAGTTEGTGQVQVETNGLIRIMPIRLARAWPDSILVESSVFSLSSGFGNTATINLQLIRRTGSPAQGIRAAMVALDTIGGMVGVFGTADASGADGKATVRYTPGATAYRGPLSIRATVDTGGGAVTGAGFLQIVP